MAISVLHLLLPLLLSATVVLAMSSQRLLNQRVLVTGAGRGIGRAIAIIFSRHGAKVALVSRTRSELEETACQCPSETIISVADVTNEHQVHQMVQAIVETWGGLDVLVNNAGGPASSKGLSHQLDSDDLERLLRLNVVAVHRVTKVVLQNAMNRDGRIVNISSRAAKVGLPTVSFYVASKFAVEGLSASMAEELKNRNISVNTISPGMVDTRSFPKPKDRQGVRTPESIEDGLFVVLESGLTGHYLHVDELDLVRQRGLDDRLAMKPINEHVFDP